jgi:hypothetical protein
MPNPPKTKRNARVLAAFNRGLSYRRLAKRFHFKSPATAHEIVQRELAKKAA